MPFLPEITYRYCPHCSRKTIIVVWNGATRQHAYKCNYCMMVYTLEIIEYPVANVPLPIVEE